MGHDDSEKNSITHIERVFCDDKGSVFVWSKQACGISQQAGGV